MTRKKGANPFFGIDLSRSEGRQGRMGVGARLGYAFTFAVILVLALAHSEFFSRKFVLAGDTFTYTNLPGASAGLAPSNFSSTMRTPGYSLFLSLVTLGKIPNPQALRYTFCGSGVVGGTESCATAVPAAEVVLRHSSVVWEFSKEIEALFQRAITASKLLFVVSLLLLFWALTRWIHPVSAAVCVAVVCVSVPSVHQSHFLDTLQTESLFPSLVILYLAFIALYAANQKGRYLVAASLTAVACFLVRPVFIYLVAMHAVMLLYILVRKQADAFSFIASVAAIVIPVAWVFFWSPIVFFSVADFQQSAMRAAILSDDRTLACIEDNEAKTVLAAYVRSVNRDASALGHLKPGRSTNLERYYAFAFSNSYNIEQDRHPMYKEPGIRALVDESGGTVLKRALDAAAICNRWRNIEFAFQVVRATFGIGPGFRPFVPNELFNRPYVFYLLAFLLVAGTWTLLRERRYSLAFLVAYSVAIHLAMVFLVALKQGGESRYTNVTESLFILGAVICALVMVEAAIAHFRRPRQQTAAN